MNARLDWLKERQSILGVGASESAALFGLHPYLSPFALFEKLVNPRPLTEDEIEEESDVQSFGLAIQPYLANWYQRKTGRRVFAPLQSVNRLKDRPYVFASLDDEYVSEEHDPEPMTGALELKSAIYFNESEPLPDYWQVQVQQQMLCADLRISSFAILGGFRRRYLVNDIPRNDAFCEILIETIERFMAMVQAGVFDRAKWEIEGSSATREAITRLYRKPIGTSVPLTDVDALRTAEWRSVKEQLAALEAREKTLNNQLRAAVGVHAVGLLPDGSQLKRIDVKGSHYEVTKEPTWYLKYQEAKG